MQQLSAQDASFLYSDTQHANANVTLLHIYNQSTAPGGKVRFKSILERIASRIDKLPMLRRRVLRVPLDLDRPYWVDDENFDLEYHVRHIALPKPGDWRQFCIQAARIHARPLDPQRPLWEIYVIEGLDSLLELPAGSFALLAKTHHAAIDVELGSEITQLLHDTEAVPPKPQPPQPWFPSRPPAPMEMFARGLSHTMTQPWWIAGPVGRRLGQAAQAAAGLAGELMGSPHALPLTRFNSVVSPHRVFETRRFLFEEFKAIRALVAGASVNDVVLAVCGGGLRRYLDLHGELPETSLSAMTPFYVRDQDAGADGSGQLAWTEIELGTAIADAVQRLAHVQAQTASSELVARAIGAPELSRASGQAPAAGLALSGKLLGRATGASTRRMPTVACTVANVPGPRQPLYLCGARMTYFSAMMPISDGMGLAFAATSYDGRIVISPTSCRDLMPDPEVFAQCVRDAFQDLLAAARAAAPRPPRARAGSAPRKGRSRASRSGTAEPTIPAA
ncbi:MAG: wax ester/triacylglycerol synthase family O-acyltransferase [Rubrivivax sp.]|nr:wax ester/triacylglycerol synthase family O-acyltransferase [Rubrivivax sp.]